MATAKKPAAKASKTTKPKQATPANPPANKPVPKGSPNAVFNIEEINQLIHAVNHSNVNELKLEKGDFKITIRQGGAVAQQVTQVVHAAPAPQAVAPPPVLAPAPPQAAAAAPVAPQPPTSEAAADNLVTIKSPMIGTFYRSAGPGKPNFVNVGDEIKAGDVLCIVEAMKLFNEIESEVSGIIVKVLADDANPVEYDQPLFLVQPK